MNFLNRKLIKLFNCGSERLSQAQADLDRREWERRNADIDLCETGMQLQSQRMELYQAKSVV